MPSKQNNVSALKSGNKEPVLSDKNTKQFKESVKPKVSRVNKGFQVEKERAGKWDLLVAQMKGKGAEDKKTGPELMDEALDYLFDKYLRT